MRILHTSDWHLGQHFMGRSRQAEHRQFLAWLVERVVEEQVDAVIVAGDVFDTGAPPSYARELYNDFIVALRETGARLVVLGGNHDSVAMLGESRTLLARLDTHVVPGVCETLGDQIIMLHQRDGSPGAVLCAIPYVRPRDVLTSQAGESSEAKLQSLQRAIQSHYQCLYELAQARRDEAGQPLPIIGTGHLTTVGASVSESVREIYVGTLEAFPTRAFPPLDYIALGHIHRPQKVGGLEHIRYCGSPIALSFDEARQQKEVLLVDLGTEGLQAVTPVAVPRFQEMASLTGDLAALERAITEAVGALQQGSTLWLEVTVSADAYLSDLQARLQSMTEGLPVEILRIRRERVAPSTGLTSPARQTLEELSVLEVFDRRLASEDLSEAQQHELRLIYRQLVADLTEGEA